MSPTEKGFYRVGVGAELGLGSFVHKINGGIYSKVNKIYCGSTSVTRNSHKHSFPIRKVPQLQWDYSSEMG